jgi:hypothetical protein
MISKAGPTQWGKSQAKTLAQFALKALIVIG